MYSKIILRPRQARLLIKSGGGTGPVKPGNLPFKGKGANSGEMRGRAVLRRMFPPCCGCFEPSAGGAA